MSDTAAEVKDTKTTTVSTPEKEKDVEKKTTSSDEKVEKETNGESKAAGENNDTSKKNGVEEKDTEKEAKPLENGESNKEEVVSGKRKSEVSGGDATDSGSPSPAEGISPEKKAKLEEKVENGEAEATA